MPDVPAFICLRRPAVGLACLLLAAGSLGGCVSVAAYQKVYLNDEDMKLANKRIEVYESNFQSYREGAGGANGGKVGGGCGCN